MAHTDHECSGHFSAPSVHQTLDELEFERGIWSAALNGDLTEVKRHLLKDIDADKTDKSGYTALVLGFVQNVTLRTNDDSSLSN